MCLDTVTERRLFADPTEEWAWKEMQNEAMTQGGYSFVTQIYHWTHFDIGAWATAKGFKDKHGLFRTGFYCYADPPREDRIQGPYSFVLPVLIRNIVTRGTIGHQRVIIARELLIPVDWEARIKRIIAQPELVHP